MKKVDKELVEILACHQERFYREIAQSTCKLLRSPTLTKIPEFTTLIEFSFVLDSIGGPNSHLQAIMIELVNIIQSVIEEEISKTEDQLESKTSTKSLKKNIKGMFSEILWNMVCSEPSSTRNSALLTALDKLWENTKKGIIDYLSLNNQELPNGLVWMDLLLKITEFLAMKDDEYRRIALEKLPNYEFIQFELIAWSSNRDPKDISEVKGFTKEKKPLEVEVTTDQSFMLVKLDTMKEYLIHLDKTEGDSKFKLAILKPHIWILPIPDRHEYTSNYYPYATLSATDGRRLAKVRGCWSVGIAAVPHSNSEMLDELKAKVSLYSRDIGSRDKTILSSDTFLSLYIPKQLPDAPFLGEIILELPPAIAPEAEADLTKQAYLSSLSVSRPLTSLERSRFASSSISPSAHREQIARLPGSGRRRRRTTATGAEPAGVQVAVGRLFRVRPAAAGCC
jgi:hypothetical protein